ncbi:Uncharacterised protein [Vibrio owensii]|uniref:hypothetical protein n=1 Tax=Vibrio owensii TaxID=696485 RepID=UPI0003A380C9|nr:hypothetical protein [Vibrio owensii]SUQ02066.1 Uncharacterised protein [Vibrio owensii]
MSKIINGAAVGVVVGVLSAIIAFLLSYNSMIIQLMDKKEEAFEYYQNVEKEVDDFKKQVDNIKKDLPITLVQYEELIRKIEKLQESRLYLNEFGSVKSYNPSLHEATALIHNGVESPDLVKRKIYKLIVNGKFRELHQELSMKFVSIMDNQDWFAVYDMSLGQDDEFLFFDSLVNNSAVPCLESSRSEIFNRAKKDLIKSYESGEELDYDTRELIKYLSEPNKCFTRDDLKILISISEKYGDIKLFKDFSVIHHKYQK